MSKPGDIAETLLMLTRERDEARAQLATTQEILRQIRAKEFADLVEARAIARRLATMVRLFVTVAPSTEYQAEHTLRDFAALPWAQDTSS